MAEGDAHCYNNFLEQLMEGSFDLVNDTVKTALLAGHALDIDNDTVWADVSGDEEAGAGYSAGGETLAGKDVTQDDVNDRGVFDATDETWTGLDVGTPSHAVMYDVTAGNLLMIAWELATATNGGDFTLQWHGDGICYIEQV